jgi:hypothetical protein
MMSELSEKIRAYIEKIEKETGRPISIKMVQDVGLRGMKAEFELDPEYIRVKIVQNIETEKFEQSIAHEITHGFLAYKKKYCQLDYVQEPNEIEGKSIDIIVTMIEDIVVNKIIQEENFQPYPYDYLDKIQNDTKNIRKSKGRFPQLHQDPVLNDRIMILRYIGAWSLLKYFNLDSFSLRVISKFIKCFKKSYPKQYEAAEQIEEIIFENNIFTSEGYYKAIKRCLELWNLVNLVKFVTV